MSYKKGTPPGKNYKMEALDEEDSQMEGLTRNIDELEKALQHKNLELQTLETSREKALAELTIAMTNIEELHDMSKSLVSGVENLQLQLQDRNSEVFLLRQEVTRCTNEVPAASQEKKKRHSQHKNLELQTLEASREKALAELSSAVTNFEELHDMSKSLVSGVENLQLQLQDRNTEVFLLRQEVTRCTNEVLAASQEKKKRHSNESAELVTCLSMMASRLRVGAELPDDKKGVHVHAYTEILESQIKSVVSELKILRIWAQSGDSFLEAERSRVEELLHRKEAFEYALREKETQLSMLQGAGFSGQAPVTSSEILEVKPVVLDEDLSQMEGLTSKIDELEKALQQKNLELETLEASRRKALAKLSIAVTNFEELHDMSKSFVSGVENLQIQLQDRDTEVFLLRQEVTRCTNEVLAASQEKKRRHSNESAELVTWLSMIISRLGVHDELPDDKKGIQMHAYKEILESQITSIVSELENLRVRAQSRDTLLEAERSRVEELLHREEALENALHEKETKLSMLQGAGVSGQAPMTSSEILELEPMMNRRKIAGASIAPHVRSLQNSNNDQVAISVDMDPGSSLLDDDKVHGFKSLTMSRVVPRFIRPVTDIIDGLWVSCDRALMRQPALRLGIMIYWGVLHMLLAAFIV